jgi:hypothetical protein
LGQVGGGFSSQEVEPEDGWDKWGIFYQIAIEKYGSSHLYSNWHVPAMFHYWKGPLKYTNHLSKRIQDHDPTSDMFRT